MRYNGARLFNDLYTEIKKTGSQRKFASTGEIESYFFTIFRSLAATFWTDCNRAKDAAEMPPYSELLKSRRYKTNVWITLSKSAFDKKIVLAKRRRL